jgi:serine protease AprX
MRIHLKRLATAALTAAVAGAMAGPAHAATPDSIVQFRSGVDAAAQRAAVRAAGGHVTRDLHLIHALGATLPGHAAARLSHDPRVAAVAGDAEVHTSAVVSGQQSVGSSSCTTPGSRWQSIDPCTLKTSFVQSLRVDKVWTDPNYANQGEGATVAVIDTGIAGDMPDFADADGSSRVVESVVTNPDATTATDLYGHGTHVAGIIAGNSYNRPATDSNYGAYRGVAPRAKLVSVKVSDDIGATSLIDVIYGLQFVVDHKADYNIRVVNLSLNSTVAQSYATDPLDAAVEAAWNSGIVVVTAAGNRGTDADAVSYAPANDPYVITVGAADDAGTKATTDDALATWSSRGVTQDGFAKPDVYAPGAHIVSTVPAGSAFFALCPSCVKDAEGYFQVGGTSMAAPMVSGLVADLLTAHPAWTPNQVKYVLQTTGRPLLDKVNLEAAGDKAMNATPPAGGANQNLRPNSLIDPATGGIDYTRATWTRATWTTAADTLRATWSRATWTRATWTSTSQDGDAQGTTDPTRATWSRATWSTDWDR